MGLTDPGRTLDEERFGGPDPGAGGERLDARALHRRLEGEAEVGQGRSLTVLEHDLVNAMNLYRQAREGTDKLHTEYALKNMDELATAFADKAPEFLDSGKKGARSDFGREWEVIPEAAALQYEPQDSQADVVPITQSDRVESTDPPAAHGHPVEGIVIHLVGTRAKGAKVMTTRHCPPDVPARTTGGLDEAGGGRAVRGDQGVLYRVSGGLCRAGAGDGDAIRGDVEA